MPNDQYTHDTLEKIKTLKELLGNNPAYPDDIQRVLAWEAEVKRQIQREEMCQNGALHELVGQYVVEIKRIENDLLTKSSVELPDAQRDRIIDKKNLYSSFVEQFDLVKINEAIQTVDKEVQEQIDSLK